MNDFRIENGVLKAYVGGGDVVIPNSVTSIGETAFAWCARLASVTIPDSVTNIGSEAFIGCTGLTSITIPDSVTNIGYGAFGSCTGLNSVTIGKGVTSICDYVFYKCISLTSITIPNSVTNIGDGAFYKCDELTSKQRNYKACKIKNDKFKCMNYEYKIGEWSDNAENILPCAKGYHFCTNLFNIFNYYSGELDKDIAIFECEADSKIITEGNKSVTNKIKLVKRLYKEDVIRILNGEENE